jgi:2-isopropylmalate synthase
MYNALCPMFREVVFHNSKEQTLELAARHSKLISELADQYSASHGMKFRYEYSPETFTQTELEFSLQVCEAVKTAWGKAGPGIDRIIFNLPATVEIAPPNHYADQVGAFREVFITSVHHTHRSNILPLIYLSEKTSLSVYTRIMTEVRHDTSNHRRIF